MNSGLSLLSGLPILGQGVTVAKYGNKALNVATETAAKGSDSLTSAAKQLDGPKGNELPGAKLQKTSKGFTQMDDEWIEMNLNRMKNSKKYPERNQLGDDLLDAIEDKNPKVNKLVIEAIEDNGTVVGGKLQPLP
ncbi:hypothetical protein FC654_21405 [Vibrio vulnificus]|nr:hypothetical protein [Vibrio vulnificus]